MPEDVLSIPQIVKEKVLPLSMASLYRIASEGAEDSPFRKRQGRWMATREDLLQWVREGERGKPRESQENPMPSALDLMGDIEKLRTR